MNSFTLVISTPDGDLFRDSVYALFLRGAEGDLAILPGHIQFMTIVREGGVKIEYLDGTQKFGKTRGGILTVSDKEVILLSGSFEFDE